MAFRTGLANFSKGELSDELAARVDVAARNSGVKRARNVIIQKYGGLTKRPGTRIVAEVFDASEPVRLFPFQFSIDQTYALEMGQGYMRPAALGGMVIEEEITITGITNEPHAKVTAAFHGYAVGDDVFFEDVAGMTEINGRIGRVLFVFDADNFAVDINTATFSTFSGDSGGITRVGAPAPPPAPPPVPAPTPAPAPPPVGGGGGGGTVGGGGHGNPYENIP